MSLPPYQISLGRGAPPTRLGSRSRLRMLLRPTLHPGSPGGSPGRSPRTGLVLWDPLPRARLPSEDAEKWDAPGHRGPSPGAPSLPQLLRGRTASRTRPRRAPPRVALASERLPASATQVRAPGSPSRILLPRTASRLTTRGRLISAATPAELRAPPARRLPRGPPLARALALPHSLRPFPRPLLLLAPLPSASLARLPPHSAPRQSGVRFGPFQFQSCPSSESPPQPSPPPQTQGSRVPMGRRADGLGRSTGW